MTEATTSPASGSATLNLLWERVRRRGDMPGFTRAINNILAAMRGEDQRDFSMAQTVLSDPVLTQKVLRLANSGMYCAFGQRINTVSKAVLVLGTDAIGHLALGLKLIEELAKSRPDCAGAQAEMEKAILAGMVAQRLAVSASTRDPEEAVVCAILHALGRMMVTFYLPERWARMQELGGPDQEDQAAPEVLGLSLEAVGRAAAEQWGLPSNLIAGMRLVPPSPSGARVRQEDWLAAISSMASQCARALWHDDAAGAARIEQLAAAYGPMLGLEPPAVLSAIAAAREHAATELTVAPLARPAEKQAAALAHSRKRAEGNQVLRGGMTRLREAAAGPAPGTGHALTVALETLHQGLGAQRAFAFLRHRREGRYVARLARGEAAGASLPQLAFADSYEADVFHAALASDRVIFIEHAQESRFASKLPAWWRKSLSAQSFLIVPFSAHGHAAGFLYLEWDTVVSAGTLGATEFALLNELRTALGHALERRHQVEAATGR